jgi:hypothetical protein
MFIFVYRDAKIPVFTPLKIRNFLYQVAHWETWPYLVKYIPLFPAWMWFCARARSCWFFTASNPTLTFGGFEGESKSEMYAQLPEGSYPKSILIKYPSSLDDARRQAEAAGLSFPFAVKPDVGMMGFMFRKIENMEQFGRYHAAMTADYILQSFIDYPVEVSVFYYRFPNKSSGNITGFLRKEFLQVTGNGTSTLLELIQQYPRVRFRLEEMKSKHEKKLHEVIPHGEIYALSYALNLSRGGRLVSLAHEKDARLLRVFDALAENAPHFYYGRYDIKCRSVEDLRQGSNFSILEYNGSGAEPHHIYGDGNNLVQAYRIVLHHWNVLYRISRYNHHNGIPYWSFRRGYRFLRKAKKRFKALKKLDATFEI